MNNKKNNTLISHVEGRLNDALMKIIIDWELPVWKYNYYLTNEVPTAAIDKDRNIYLNPEFMNKLDQKTFIKVVLHEIMHDIFRHFLRFEKNHTKANIAQDLAINSLIGLVPTPEVPCLHPGYGKFKSFPPLMSAEWYYERIPDDAKDNGHDDHSKMDESEQQNGNSNNSSTGNGNAENKQENGNKNAKTTNKDGTTYKKKVDINVGSNEKYGFNETPEQTIQRLYKKHKIDFNWEKVLAKFLMQEEVRTNRENKKNEYLNNYKTTTEKIDLFIDVSGSIKEETYNKVINAVRKLKRTHELKIFYFADIVSTKKEMVGGGTNINAVLEKINPKNKTIIMTDGEFDTITKILKNTVFVLVGTKNTATIGKNKYVYGPA